MLKSIQKITVKDMLKIDRQQKYRTFRNIYSTGVDVMAIKYLFVAVCLYVSVNTINAALETVNGKIKISVVTTAGCGDTVNFITNSLAKAYEEYKDFLEVEFVPWGRTRRNPDGSLYCQFGANDCFANRVNRCALDMLKGNQDAQMQYMVCEFTNPRPAYLQGSYLCAQTVGLNLVDLDYCVAHSGTALDNASELIAAEPMKVIDFVPAIYFNDAVDVGLHAEAWFRLSSTLCFALAEDVTTGVTNCQI